MLSSSNLIIGYFSTLRGGTCIRMISANISGFRCDWVYCAGFLFAGTSLFLDQERPFYLFYLSDNHWIQLSFRINALQAGRGSVLRLF